MFNRGSTAFTLIELLIVVAIIAILAAIAVPNFLEAQTRAKISRVKNDLRVLNVAIEAYQIDNNSIPIHQPTPWSQWNLLVEGLNGLTSPVSFTTNVAMKDPFSGNKDPNFFPQGAVRSYFWFDYSSKDPMDARWFVRGGNGETGHNAYLAYSSGPSRASVGIEWCFMYSLNPPVGSFTYTIKNTPWTVDNWYDPTNGTMSYGGIARWGGEIGIATP